MTPKGMFNRSHQEMDETVKTKAVRINPTRTVNCILNLLGEHFPGIAG